MGIYVASSLARIYNPGLFNGGFLIRIPQGIDCAH